MYIGDEGKFSIEDNVISQGLPYDLESSMHFRHNAFARNKSLSTILPLAEEISPDVLGFFEKGTYLDFLHVNFLYCKGKSFEH